MSTAVSSKQFAYAAKSIQYSQELIQKASITPNDAGCQDWLAGKLAQLGFDCVRFEQQGVSNLIASKGSSGRTIAFAGHTDIVPPGKLDSWHCSPFAATIQDDYLLGRGAADMKTGLAAMLAATERYVEANADQNNILVWLVTSDEEGEAEHGSKAIKAYLDSRDIRLDMCIVGEPTANKSTGDAIKVGRRGALSARLEVTGKQGHVAYPQYADNAIHKMNKVIQALLSIDWDHGSDDFPGSSLQITHIDSGDFTDNIVPPRCAICFNIRHSHLHSHVSLEKLINEKLRAVTEDFSLSWERPCEPYFTVKQNQHSLIDAVERAIHKNTGSFPLLSTSGGTSDGRFFASEHTQVVEVGVPNYCIHQVNERVHLADLVTLEDIYTDLLTELL